MLEWLRKILKPLSDYSENHPERQRMFSKLYGTFDHNYFTIYSRILLPVIIVYFEPLNQNKRNDVNLNEEKTLSQEEEYTSDILQQPNASYNLFVSGHHKKKF